MGIKTGPQDSLPVTVFAKAILQWGMTLTDGEKLLLTGESLSLLKRTFFGQRKTLWEGLTGSNTIDLVWHLFKMA